MTASDDRTLIPLVPGHEDREGFGTRWSRYTLEARRNGGPAQELDLAAGNQEIAPAAEPDAPALTDTDMPPIESLDESSDYSLFLSPKVSQELRTCLRL